MKEEAAAGKAKLGMDVFKSFLWTTKRYRQENDSKIKLEMEEKAFKEFTAIYYLRRCKDRFI